MARAPAQIEAPPQSDQIEGLAHPRALAPLLGHQGQQKAFADAVASGRLHHAWLLTGPKGIGKASFAYHAAARLMDGAGMGAEFGASGGIDFAQRIEGASAAAARIRNGSHGDLKSLSRPWNATTKKFRNAITVDEVRGLVPFFGSTSSEEGYRIVVIDAAEDMNRNAANALLKLLEEPPKRSLFFLISHAPGRLLPTIRSRCRVLRFDPLADDVLADIVTRQKPDIAGNDMHVLTHLAAGAPGRALELALADGMGLYSDMIGGMAGLPRLDLGKADLFAGKVGGAGKDAQFDLFCSLYTDWLRGIARGLARGVAVDDLALLAEEKALISALAQTTPVKLVDYIDEVGALAAKTRGLNLDRRQMVVTCFEKLARLARAR